MQKRQHDFRPSDEKRKVLIIEDEFINQELLKAMLEGTYEVICASTGKEALDVIKTQYETLSIILLDLNLPDMKGLDLLQNIKSTDKYSALPVIVMTADSEAEVECLTLGAIDFIPKPYPRQKVVLARILRTIELSENRDILHQTERDQLTGLYNKEFFYRYAVLFDSRYKEDPTDAIVLDVNHFHTINDRYGKSYGDVILKKIANKVLEVVGGEGIVCRSGSDSFLIYCLHRDDYNEMSEKISVKIDEGSGRDNNVRIRMGVYSDVDKELDIERRFDRAKMAADRIKGSVTNVIGIYDKSMYEEEMLSEQLIEDFSSAISEKQFKVFYQPKYDVRKSEPLLCSAEALVRWVHPKMGMVSPGVFIPLFENNGLIQELDRYVWSEAASQVREWKEKFGVTIPVSINVSRVDLYDPDLIEKLCSIVEDNGLCCDDLVLEITESAYTENSEQIVEKVKELRNIGFKIEMDDFGSGYSSLNMLSTLPIDALKLDMYFIRNAFKDRKDTRLLEAMIQLAASFEVPTIAEGVETAEQVFTLKTMGCDIIQGYYFSRPLPAAEFEPFILNRSGDSPFIKEKTKNTRHDQFTYNALHDPLTGLYNYTAFDILFHDSDRDHIAVILADVDNYEAIEREKGKDQAKRVICRAANVLKSNFRTVDHICRLRDDEFAIIMARITNADKELVFSKIEKVNLALSEYEDGTEPISLCVGVAFSDSDRPDSDVFGEADAALERAKKTHGSDHSVFDGSIIHRHCGCRRDLCSDHSVFDGSIIR